MSVMFTKASEASSGGLKLADLEGCLVVMKPDGEPDTVQTAHGDGEYTPAKVLVVKGADELQGEWHDMWVFAKAVQGQLRGAAKNGAPLVGEVGRGDAKPGKSAPWLLLDPDADGLEAARAAYVKAEAGF